jgi:CRP/FNR family transcriptional regulator
MEAVMSIPIKNVDSCESPRVCTHDYKINCSTCRLGSLCLPLALESDDVVKLETIIQRGKPLQKGEHLYQEGSHFNSVYAVRSGAIKAYRVTDDGREQITGFYFPGEILGMDGISKNTYACSARALETSAVCEIPFSSLEDLSARLPNLQRHFFQLMSREITEDQQLITLLSKNTAEERIAALMLSISARNARRKLSPNRFRLPMSRIDIGNYLGLTVETVSRVFSRLQKLEVMEVSNKEINILDVRALQDVAKIVIQA